MQGNFKIKLTYGFAYLMSISYILSITAAPALAVIAASNSVNTYSIINGQVKSADLGKAAVTSVKIKDGQVAQADIASNAVTGSKILDGTIANADIAADAAITASKINRADLNADLLDGLDSNAFSRTSHNHGSAYSPLTHTHDDRYYTKTEADGRFAPMSPSGETTSYYVMPTSELNGTSSGRGFFFNDQGGDPEIIARPIHLPHGVRVTGFSLQARDNFTKDATATLYFNNNPDVPYEGIMAQVVTSGEVPDWRMFNDSTINDPVIDNKENQYTVELKMPGGDDPLGGEPALAALKYAKIVIEYVQ